MATQILGPHFDIHGGGMDLMFPHHENEIAQSCAACDSQFVNYWMHNGFVRVDNEKMSKSLGNFFTIREVLGWVRDAEVIRYFMLSSHYRGPINYAIDNLDQADAALERLYLALRGLDLPMEARRSAATDRFQAAMDDDFNTPLALSELQQMAKDINVAKAKGDLKTAADLGAEMVHLSEVLGILRQAPDVFLRKAAPKRGPEAYSTKVARGTAVPVGAALSDAQIDDLVRQRTAARKSKDWKESDRIRDELSAQGILLEDGPQGTTWRRH
jgi:cysteinyl-tRNA synthetase